MHLVSLELENYRQFKKANLDFVDGVLGIVGLNGAGKSSLVEAIAWALYGNVASRTIKENIKRDSAEPEEDVLVILKWEMHGKAYEVTRKLRGEKMTPDVQFKINEELQARSAKVVQQAIEKTLGLDWQSFYTSFFARQKELNALSDLNASGRKDLILRMLRIDAVDLAIKNAKEELKVIKTKKEVIGQRLGQLAELNKQFASKEKELELVQEKLEKNKDKHLNIEKEYKNIEKEYVAEKKKAEKYQIRERNLKNLELEIEREQKHLEAMNKAQQEIVFKAAEFNKTEKEYKEIKKSIESIRKKIETVKMSSGELQAKRDIYRQQYQELVKKEENILNLGPKAKCPTCQRPLANDLQAIEKHFNSEKTTLSKQGQELNVQIKAIEKEEAVLLTELKENGKEETTLLKSYQNMLAAKSKKEQLEKQKEKITKEIEKLKPEVLESKNALEEIEFDSAKYKNLEKSYNKISGEYQQAKESWQQSSFQEQLIKKEVDLLKAQLIKVKEDEKALKELTGEHENLQSLLEVFANFRVYLISKIRPTLGLIAGRLFAQMTQGKYSGLELDEDYEIYIEDQGKKYSLSRFSGGEMDLANLCLRLAISQYVTEQYGAEMYFVVLDEIFGSQDVLRKNAILEALVELNKRFRQIILITHVEEIKDVVGQVVRVYENEDGISYVQV